MANLPLLDFVEAGEEGDGDEDHDCFFAVADFELEGREGGLVVRDQICEFTKTGVW